MTFLKVGLPVSLDTNDFGRLVPFFVTVCIYTIISSITSAPLWVKGLSKILPLICLCVYILNHGRDFISQRHRVQKLLLALLFSAAGDVLLLMNNTKIFIVGAAMFALAHCFYTWAFGFEPLNVKAGGLIGVAVVLGLTFLSTCSNIYQVLLLCLYCFLIGLMSWRANAPVLFRSHRPSPRVTGAMGAWLFMVSDFILATNLLCFTVPFQNLIVMSTYYMAQLFITLGIVKENEKID
ncbi:lysoplasmalogenase TMEM86A-like isoform X2 [Rhinoraja longicauda]